MELPLLHLIPLVVALMTMTPVHGKETIKVYEGCTHLKPSTKERHFCFGVSENADSAYNLPYALDDSGCVKDRNCFLVIRGTTKDVKVVWDIYMRSDDRSGPFNGGSVRFAVSQKPMVMNGQKFPDGTYCVDTGNQGHQRLYVSRSGGDAAANPQEFNGIRVTQVFERDDKDKARGDNRKPDIDDDSGKMYYHYKWWSRLVKNDSEAVIDLRGNISVAVVVNAWKGQNQYLGKVENVPPTPMYIPAVPASGKLIKKDDTWIVVTIVVIIVVLINAAVMTFIWFWRKKRLQKNEEKSRAAEQSKISSGKKTANSGRKKVPPLKFAS